MESSGDITTEPSAATTTTTLINNNKKIDPQNFSPKTINAIIRRCRALVRELVSTEIEKSSITSTEGIINKQVLNAFALLAGDFTVAMPYCLLESRKLFQNDANNNLNMAELETLRMVACETLASRLISMFELQEEKQLHLRSNPSSPDSPKLIGNYHEALTTRFSRLDNDGDKTIPTSALESAIDQHAIDFLSNPPVQNVINHIWCGDLVQTYDAQNHSHFGPYQAKEDGSFVAHFDPSRLSVPKYTYWLSISIWVFFLIVFSIQSRTNKDFDIWEGLTWIMAIAYLIEDICRWIKIGGFDVLSFWTVIDVATDTLFTVALCFRIGSFIVDTEHAQDWYQQRTFELLSGVAPLLWIQITRMVDSFVYFGTLQVIILRMLREFALFSTLLIVICVGFFHSLYALDAADENRAPGAATRIIKNMIAAFLGAADLESEPDGAAYVLYTIFVFIITVILLNVLIAFFSVAQSEVVDSVMLVYSASFSEKVIGLSRTPDEFIFLAPFNLLEGLLLAPFERFIPRKTYVALNRWVQSIIFFIPLCIIAFYESRLARSVGAIILDTEPTDEELAQQEGTLGTIYDPETPDDEEYKDLNISKVSFEKLVQSISSK